MLRNSILEDLVITLKTLKVRKVVFYDNDNDNDGDGDDENEKNL